MQTHPRRRLEIVIEAPILKRVEALLSACAVHVYTVLEARSGRGLAGRWDDQSLSEGMDQRVLIAVTTQEAADKVFAGMAEIFQRYPGVIYASDVDVLRAERF
ncbi:MAG: P-II family nitrogen regulator [Caulobacterales bacterium]|jgi:nitrogen regulatory protein PII